MAAGTIPFLSGVSDGASAVAKKNDTIQTLANAGARLEEWYNGSVKKLGITKDGLLTDGNLWRPVTAFIPTGSFTNTTYTGFYCITNGVMTYMPLLVASGTPGAGNLTLNLPTDLAWTIDTAKMVTMPGAEPLWVESEGYMLNSGTGNNCQILAAVNSTTSLKFYYGNGTSIAGQITASAPFSFTVNDLFWGVFKFPVTV